MVMFEALEPVERRELRERRQMELLRELRPDFCFLQEVNPVVPRAREFGDVLEMDSCEQPDLVGLKVFGVGVPLNLNSGLALLASRRLGLKPVLSLSLSRPHFNWVRSWASWQLKEERFALFAETLVPDWGRVLLVNTHLHHGLELTADLRESVDRLAKEMELNSSFVSELSSRFEAGNARRASEIGVLLRHLSKLPGRYAAVVLCGDFNCSPESEVADTLREHGFRDAWVEGGASGVAEAKTSSSAGYTFDASVNVANHILQEKFPLSLTVEDLTFSAKTKDALLALARGQESRPRRIDYVWFRPGSEGLKLRVARAEMVGLPDTEGVAPSDHFGVCVDLERV